MRRAISVPHIISLVCPRAPDWPAAEQCCAALRESQIQSIDAGQVDRASLVRIYGIRLARRPDAVVGADRLLSDLESSSEDQLFLVALEWEGRAYCMLLDSALTGLVACFAGEDRRWAP